MNRQSESFQIIISSNEHQQLVARVGTITLEKDNLMKVIQEQTKRLQLYAKKSEELEQYPKKIFRLSKTVLAQSKIIIELQQLCQKFKKQHNKNELKQETRKQKLQQEMQALTTTINSNNIQINSLLSQNNLLKGELQVCQINISNLQNQITFRELQLQQMKKRLESLQQENKEKDETIIKKISMLDEREKKMIQKQQLLKNQEKIIQQKLQAKIFQLQNEYTKRIQSLKDYTAQQQQIQRLKSTVQRLSISNQNSLKKIKSLQKNLTEANSKIEYLRQLYQDENNIQNLFLDIYIKSLDKYRNKLIEVSQKNIQSKIFDKKNQLIKALQKRIKQQLHLF